MPAKTNFQQKKNDRTAAMAATAEDGRDFNNSRIPSTAETPTTA